ncbi:MAG TPA: RnfABCDGE type electron transport complex subunit G [Myxococcota bacterium]|mgnify:CR=1 FL=1|nr:RnfABCDGE type electron transport complex subunit G [Myxococcota bacterium]
MKEEVRYVVVLTLITVVSAAVLAAVSQVTAGPIAEARRAKTLNALKQVLPPFDNAPDQEMSVVSDVDPATLPAAKRDRLPQVYPARKGGELVGVAVRVTDPNGYAGDVTYMVGLKGDPATPTVIGYDVLSHKETPGLGTKLKDAPFKGQFEGLAYPAAGDLKVKKDGGTIDAITGATISSRTATAAVNTAVGLYRERAADLRKAPAAPEDPAAAPEAAPADPATEEGDNG